MIQIVRASNGWIIFGSPSATPASTDFVNRRHLDLSNIALLDLISFTVVEDVMPQAGESWDKVASLIGRAVMRLSGEGVVA